MLWPAFVAKTVLPRCAVVKGWRPREADNFGANFDEAVPKVTLPETKTLISLRFLT